MQAKKGHIKMNSEGYHRVQQRAEREHMMEVWMEDAKVFRKESWRAREERHRLETIHRKVHARAQTARPAVVALSLFLPPRSFLEFLTLKWHNIP